MEPPATAQDQKLFTKEMHNASHMNNRLRNPQAERSQWCFLIYTWFFRFGTSANFPRITWICCSKPSRTWFLEHLEPIQTITCLGNCHRLGCVETFAMKLRFEHFEHLLNLDALGSGNSDLQCANYYSGWPRPGEHGPPPAEAVPVWQICPYHSLLTYHASAPSVRADCSFFNL